MNPDAGVAGTFPTYPAAARTDPAEHHHPHHVSSHFILLCLRDSTLEPRATFGQRDAGGKQQSRPPGLSRVCRGIPSIAVLPGGGYNPRTVTGPPEPVPPELAERPPGTGWTRGRKSRLPQAGRDDGATLGEAGRHARASSRARQAGIGLCLPERSRRLGARPQASGRRQRPRPEQPAPKTRPPQTARSAPPSLYLRRRDGGWASWLLAQRRSLLRAGLRSGSCDATAPESACGCPISAADRLRGHRAGRRVSATEGSWPFFRIATGGWTSGSPRSAPGSSTT